MYTELMSTMITALPRNNSKKPPKIASSEINKAYQI